MSTPLDMQAAADEAKQEDDGQVITLDDATGVPYEPKATMTVVGSYSKAYKAVEARQRKQMLRQRRAKFTGQAFLRQQLELTAACITSWEGIVANGEPVPCTDENKITLLESAPWVREQVEEVMHDHASFFRTKSTSS